MGHETDIALGSFSILYVCILFTLLLFICPWLYLLSCTTSCQIMAMQWFENATAQCHTSVICDTNSMKSSKTFDLNDCSCLCKWPRRKSELWGVQLFVFRIVVSAAHLSCVLYHNPKNNTHPFTVGLGILLLTLCAQCHYYIVCMCAALLLL